MPVISNLVYSDQDYTNNLIKNKKIFNAKLTRVKAVKGELAEAAVSCLVVSDSKLEQCRFTAVKLYNFILSNNSQILYSNFTNVAMIRNGAIIGSAIASNIFRDVRFSNIHVAKSMFVKNAFIDCVFTNCKFDTSIFKDCSFSGTVFHNNEFCNESIKSGMGHMISCDFDPTNVLGPWGEFLDGYPELKGMKVKCNFDSNNKGLSLFNSRGITNFRNYSLHDAPSGTKSTQPIKIINNTNTDYSKKPVMFVSGGL